MKALLLAALLLPGWPGQASESLTGIWTGYYRCNNRPVKLDLVLEQQGDRLDGAFVFYLGTGDKPSGGYALSGRVDNGTLTLKPGRWHKRPIGFMAVGLKGRRQGDVITGAIQSRQCSDFRVSLDQARTEQALAEAQQQEQAWQQAPVALADARDEQQRCLAIAKWASQLQAEFPDLDLRHTPLNRLYTKAAGLFADVRFVPFFGQPFDGLSKAQRKAFHRKTLSPCGRYPELRSHLAGYKHLIGRPFTLDQGEFNAAEVALRVQIDRQARQWQQDSIARLAGLPASEAGFRALAELRGQSEQVLADLWPSDRAPFAHAVQAALARLAPPLLEGRVERALAKARHLDDLPGLEQLLADNAELVAQLPQAQLEEHRARLAEKEALLLGQALEQALAELSLLPDDLDGLAQANAWYQDFQARFGRFEAARLADARQAFAHKRLALLAAIRPQLVALFERVEQLQGLDKLVAHYLGLPGDRSEPALAPLWQLIQERRQALVAKRQYLASNRRICDGVKEPREPPPDSPGARDVCLAIADTLDEMNAGYQALSRRCQARQFRDNPLIAMQCLSLCATSKACELAFHLTRFHYIACAPADGEPGWNCDFDYRLTGNTALMKEVMATLGTGQGGGRFIKVGGAWRHMRR
ncbi:hypothetical protein [Gallaecimonas sp. GXIMD4217]|uniref:hypothetical protein n=1 Tax=Gallaecimonas sp. GXIMD4217 TaxID=3131927 RepID=UPI00311B397A